MSIYSWISLGTATAYALLILLFAIAIVMQRRPVGVSLAWLVLLFAIPLLGMLAYLLLGRQRLGARRAWYARSLYPGYHQWRVHLSRLFVDHWQGDPLINESRLYHFIENSMDMPALPGNYLELCLDSYTMLDRIVDDINQANSSVKLQFYTWWPEGKIKKINDALLVAIQRGVQCQVLLDAVGSRYFLKSNDAKKLAKAGVQITESLPVGLIRLFFERIDIRNHRKIIIIDDSIAWTGSFNLIDPKHFKKKVNVGEWIDAMVRMKGPSVFMINAVFLWDWQIATGADPKLFFTHPEYTLFEKGNTYVHVLPSSPDLNRERLHQALLTAIYESKQEIIITTPYFVPDDALFSALTSAAKRGVVVHLILPKTTDSRLARFASRSYYQTLLEAGAQIFLFKEGLLHTKCVLVDKNTVLFGSVNMDMRSVWLNMELTLVVYNKTFARKIHAMVSGYLEKTMTLDLPRWRRRTFVRKLAENAAQLFSPLL